MTITARPRGWHLGQEHLRGGWPADRRRLRQLRAALLPQGIDHERVCLVRTGPRHPSGTIRATYLIETYPAVFEMTELRQDRHDGAFVRSYADRRVRACHEHGAHAVGRMVAFVPSSAGPEVARRALEKMRSGKAREARDGFDGPLGGAPGLLDTGTTVFDGELGERPHEISRRRGDALVTAADLADLRDLSGGVTLQGIRTNLQVSLTHVRSWVQGQGTVAIDNLMEDAPRSILGNAAMAVDPAVTGRVQGVFYRDSCRGEAHLVGGGLAHQSPTAARWRRPSRAARCVDALVAWRGRRTSGQAR